MKYNNILQHFTESDNSMSDPSISSQTASKMSCLPDAYKSDKLLIPAMKTETYRYESPGKKMYFNNIAFKPSQNFYLKGIPARLSDIELAIDNYDAILFQSTINSLAGLFINMNMPAAILITRKMKELAGENRLQEVTHQLQLIKKIIAQFVQARQRI